MTSFFRKGVMLLLISLPLSSISQVASSGISDSLAKDSVLVLVKKLKKQGDFVSALELLEKAEDYATQSSNQPYLVQVLLERAYLFRLRSEHIRSLSLLFKAQRIAEEINDENALAEITNFIGSLHHSRNHFKEAEKYYRESLNKYIKLDLKLEIGKCYNNFGALKQDMGILDSAIAYHRQSLNIWNTLGNSGWKAISYMHIGNCQMLIGNLDSAEFFLKSSLQLMEKENMELNQSKVYSLLGNTQRLEGNNKEAINLCKKGLSIAEKFDIINFQQQACECLFQAYESVGDYKLSMNYYKNFIANRDSVYDEMKAQEMTRLELDYAYGKQQLADSLDRSKKKLEEDLIHQSELALQREERNVALFSVLGVLLLAAGLFSRLRYMRRSRKVIESERNRSDELLLNILPAEIASELKSKGAAKAKSFDQISILFTDFKGFTEISALLSPEELVKEIDACFKGFDLICEKYKIEKIKTIGDSYMAAGGLPVPYEESTKNTVLAALEMSEFIIDRKLKQDLLAHPAFEMRVGIHTGSIVAGIVGVKKFQYDVWGDTVNAASRMESNGAPGMVNISKATYEIIKNEPCFKFEERGKLSVKGKGEMEMFFVAKA